MMMRKHSDLLRDRAHMTYTEMYRSCGIYMLDEYIRWRKCNDTIGYRMVSRLMFKIWFFEYTIISIVALNMVCYGVS